MEPGLSGVVAGWTAISQRWGGLGGWQMAAWMARWSKSAKSGPVGPSHTHASGPCSCRDPPFLPDAYPVVDTYLGADLSL